MFDTIIIENDSLELVESMIVGEEIMIAEVGVQGPQGIQGEQGIQGIQGPAGVSTWGSISGTLSNQTDLQAALDAKNTTDVSQFYLFEDFISSVLFGPLTSSPSGTGAAFTFLGAETQRPGVNQHATGSTNTGRSALSIGGTTSFLFGGTTWVLESATRIPTLSTSAERFGYFIGFADTFAMNQVDGAYFLYDEGAASTGAAASANWQCVTCSNSNRTFTVTSVPVTAAQWYKLKIEVNAAGTSVVFSIDGATVATHTTNIPTGAGRQTGFMNFLLKGGGATGTTSRTADVDYIKIKSGTLTR